MSNNELTLGSLFDGSGGFPLGGILSGIIPLWASEIEPFPIRVTTKRFPSMQHYGDVSKLGGAELSPVDIITFGSPCQDMSVAGKRAGLDGERSGLFHEAVRIVKEMRKATNGNKPRYIVWENVPGAFSSNGGEDFKAVIDEICRIKDSEADTPRPQKWPSAGLVVADDYSVAWRVFDAQYWGVPQRRKRIYLVADFAGGCAGKILFESEGLSGYSAESFRSWKRTASGASHSFGATGFDGYNGDLTGDKEATLGINCGMSTGRNGVVLNDQGGNRIDVTDDVTCTLRAEAHHPPCVMEAAGFCTEHSAKAQGIGYEEECAPTLRAGTVPAAISIENHPADSRVKLSDDSTVQALTGRMGTGGGNVPLVLKIRSGCEGGGKGPLVQTDKSATLACNNDQTLFEPTNWDGGQTAPTLTANNAGGSQRMPDKDNFNCILQPFGICSNDSNSMKSDNPHSGIYKADTSRTLDGNGGNPSCNQGGIAVVCVDMGGGKSGCGITEEKAPTLACTHAGEPVIVDTVSVEGNGSRPSHHGDGYSEEEVSYTLNATEVHGVAYEEKPIFSMTTGSFPNVAEEKAPPVLARDFKDPTVITEPSYGIGRDAFNQGANAQYRPAIEEEVQPTIVAKGPGAVAAVGFYPQMKAECVTPTEEKSVTLVNGTNPGFQNGVVEHGYTVRRLTPTECARLQGFPDSWCSDLGTPEPTDEDIRFWSEVWETHRKITGSSSKPKTENQIIKWLKDPYADASEYKMWGNGVCLNVVYYVMCGIKWAENQGDI